METLFDLINAYDYDPNGNPRTYTGPDGKDYSYEEAEAAGLFDTNTDEMEG